ncbi:MAG: alpha/beta fold hydrolase [Acidobacteria bacterium]|nr:MAG: alpha/beta fold hydrolase [Acidobacteriota bacterium]
MNKAQLIDCLCARVEGLSKRDARRLVEAILGTIKELLARGERVRIPGFGTFETVVRPARRGRNPKTGGAIPIAARTALRFRPARALRRLPEVHRAAVGRRPRRTRGRHGAMAEEAAAPGVPADLAPPEPAAPEPNYVRVDVHYATDRKITGRSEPAKFFGSDRSPGGKLNYGRCEVTIPRERRERLPRPKWYRLEFRADPAKHVILRRLTPLPADEFFRDLAAAVTQGERREAMVFVHGFNVTFEEAVLRTAQLAHDLILQGAAVCYSWPSRGKLLPFTHRYYDHDQTEADWTTRHFKGFLTDLVQRSGASRLHLIAHSMGNRVLTGALELLAAGMAAGQEPWFSEVVLTAPDVDADTFRQAAGSIARTARRITLYASKNDEALKLSRNYNSGKPRLGDVGDDLVIVPPVETVDVSAVDTNLVGHFYYGDNRSVVTDMFYLLRDGKPAAQRQLWERRRGGQTYWVFA